MGLRIFAQMRLLKLWLVVGGAALSQTAGVWHWYHHSTSGGAQPTVGWIGQGGPNFRSIPGKVVVVGDTVYVLGTVEHGNTNSIVLPNGGPSLSSTSPNHVTTYIAAYNRQDGAFLWAMHFRPQVGVGTTIRGVELLVSDSHVIYAILHANSLAPNSVEAQYIIDGQNVPQPASFIGNHFIPDYRVSFIVRFEPSSLGTIRVQRLGCGQSILNVFLCDDSNFESNFFSLLLHEGKLWASGTVKTNRILGGFTYLAPANISSSLLSALANLLGGLLTDGQSFQAVLLRMDPISLTVEAASAVQSAVALGAHPACYGRALFAYGPDTVGWLVSMRETGNKQYSIAGGSTTSFSSPAAVLRVLLVERSTMGAVIDDIRLATYSESQPGSATFPPHYYVAFQRHGNSGGELYWAVSDTAFYDISSNIYPRTNLSPRLIVCRVRITASGVSNATVLHSTEVPNLQLSGIAIEPRVGGPLGAPQPYLYLSGTLGGTSWMLQGFSGGGSVSLEGAPISQGIAAFVLGLHWDGSSWRFLGYKPFFSLAQGSQNLVHSAGMAKHPTLPQLYLYGWGRDSLVVEPRWPAGNADTVRLSTASSQPARLWIGRIDLYRLSTGSLGFPEVCTPDTIGNNQLVSITGTWAAGINRDLVWVPEASVRSYQAKQRWASILANPIGPASSFQEGVQAGSLSLLAPGRLPPGRYFLALRSPVMGNRFADIAGDTLWIDVTGTTTPQLQRAGALRWQRMVVRYAGGEPPLPSASAATQPFYRKDRSFGNIISMVYFPWEGWLSGREVLYLLDRVSNDYWLYRLDLGTGFFTPLRSWPISVTGSLGGFIFGDRVRGALWSVSENRIFWRLDSVDAGRDERFFLYQTNAAFSPSGVTTTGGYPLNSGQRWVSNVASPTCTQNGDLVFFAEHRIGSSTSRWVIARVSPERDSVYLVAGGGTSPCPRDGIGSAVTLSGSFSNITSRGDTLYWVERAAVGCANARRLLRKAWPIAPDRRIYQVLTIDTLDGTANSNYFNLEYSDVPSPGLYMNATRSSNSFMLWYDLTTRRRDTLLMCAQGSCCKYGLSDYVEPPTSSFPYVVLRSGVVLFRGGGGGEVRALLPLHLPGQGDTLRAERAIQAVSQGSMRQDTLYLSSLSDSLRLQVSVCSGGVGKSFWYGRHLVPSSSVRIIAPDSVCEGMVFHSFLQYSPGFWVEEGCPVMRPLFQWGSQMGLLSLLVSGDEVGRWYAVASGYDTLRLTLTRERWRWLFSQGDSNRPIRIRRGHRIRMQVALEGPWVAVSGRPRWMQAHPLLSRLFFAQYNSGNSGIAPDSLWQLPHIPSDSLMKSWNIVLSEPLPCPSNPSPNDWMCFPNWAQISYVEVRDATTHQRVDSAYAVVDTMGRLYLYRAPLGSLVFNFDTLSFCYCDTTNPKYFIFRTPNHLPLYTKVVSLPARGAGSADFLDLTDPSSLEGIPNLHYKLLTDSTASPMRERAAAWAGNCADVYNGFVPGPHYDAGVVNAADWEFLMPRNGVTTGYSWADLNSDGVVNAADAVLLIRNQNELRQSVGP